jgi:hypothetical protein
VGPSVALPEHGPSEAPEENVFLSATVYLLKAVGVPTDPEAAIPSSVVREGNKVPGGAVYQFIRDQQAAIVVLRVGDH